MSGQFVSKTYDRIKGWMGDDKPPIKRGLTSNLYPGSEPLAHMKIGSKWSYSTLEYPIDIQQRSDLGHYMMFYVNVIDSHRSGYSTYNSMQKKKGENEYESGDVVGITESKQTLSPAQAKLRQEQQFSVGSGTYGDEFNGTNAWNPGMKPKVIGRKHYQGRLSKQVEGSGQRTVRTTDSIVLYMPSTIQTNTNAVYKSSEMGNLVMTLAGVGSNLWSRAQGADAFNSVLEGLAGFTDIALVDLQRAIAKVGSAMIGGDIAGGIDKLSNRAQNRFLESLFDAIGFRKFSYTFKFTPKNVAESFVARDIIKLFKFHMSPELPDDDLGRYFIPPAEFDLFYMFRGDQNTFLNKISSSVLTNMDVNYANGRYQTFRPAIEGNSESAPPTEIEMKLDFMETRIITKKEVLEGY